MKEWATRAHSILLSTLNPPPLLLFVFCVVSVSAHQQQQHHHHQPSTTSPTPVLCMGIRNVLNGWQKCSAIAIAIPIKPHFCWLIFGDAKLFELPFHVQCSGLMCASGWIAARGESFVRCCVCRPTHFQSAYIEAAVSVSASEQEMYGVARRSLSAQTVLF